MLQNYEVFLKKSNKIRKKFPFLMFFKAFTNRF